MRNVIYYFIITVLLLSCSNNNTTNVPTINLNDINLTPSLLQSNYGKYFEDYGATFLENTETFKTSQIK